MFLVKCKKSRPKRKRSPVNEGTLIAGMFESGYNLLEESNIEEGNASLDEGSSSNNDIVDDTDEDPDFDPSNPGCKKKHFSFLGPRKTLDFSKPGPSTSTGHSGQSLLPSQDVSTICDTY